MQLNTNRTVLDGVGLEVLERTVSDYLVQLGTAMTIFEANGDYATGGPPRGWCQVMDELSRPRDGEDDPRAAIASGRWSCRTSCRRPALEAMERGTTAEFRCPGGLLVRAVPVRAGDEIVGSISVGCGGPPTDDVELQALAIKLGTPVERLRREAAAARTTTPDVEALTHQAIDATARLVGEIIARRRNEVKGERAGEIFVGMVAHDLRSPLSAIRMAADFLLSSSNPGQVETGMVERIRRSAARMSRMVEDLLDVTQARVGGGIPLRYERPELAALAREVIDETRLAHPKQAVRFQSDGDTTLMCDAGRVREVIENLLRNAILHGDGSLVDVAVSGNPDNVLVCVHNWGPPIPTDLLRTIFEPFATEAHRRSGEGARGLGLGLFIVRELVRAHGGRIDVESTEATGTRFSVSLPRSPPSGPTLSARQS